MKIIVTGASGFIGASLVENLVSAGFEVLAMQRSRPKDLALRVEFQQHDLSGQLDDTQFSGATFLIHTAFEEFSITNRDANKINKEGTQQLIDSCRAKGIKIIYFSTMSAHALAESNYGRVKFQIEKMFDPKQDLVLKLGLVLGRGGLFYRILRTVQRSRFIPIIGGDKPVQTVALKELLSLLTLVMKRFVPGCYAIGEPQPILMKEVYKQIAEISHANPLLIHVPLTLVLCVTYFAELISINLPVTSENVLGLKKMRSFETESSSAVFGFQFSSFDKTISDYKIRP